MHWWGWIPILTQKVFFDNIISDFILEKDVTKEESETMVKRICEYIHEHNENYSSENKKYYSQLQKGRYDADRGIKTIFSIDTTNKIDHILVFDLSLTRENQNSSPQIIAACKIENEGLVEITLFKKPGFSLRAAKTVYAKIRDVYHAHTHHIQEDLLLSPIEAKNKNIAIVKIFNEYEFKIFDYLKKIKQFIDQKMNFRTKLLNLLGLYSRDKSEDAFELLTLAKGEMLYAINFIKSFKHDAHFEEFNFTNAYNAIDILSKKIEAYQKSFFNTIMTWLTLAICILTFVLVFRFSVLLGLLLIVLLTIPKLAYQPKIT